MGVQQAPPSASGRTEPVAPDSAWPASSALRSLRYRSYRYFWLASLFTFTPWMMQFLVRGWLALQLTGSPLWVGLVAAAFQAPSLVLSFVGGVLADRFRRRNIVLTNEVVQLAGYLLLTGLFMSHSLDRWSLLSLSLASGISFALAMPARQSMVPRLVPVADTMNGIVLTNGVFSTAQIVGPALGGVLIGAWGEGAALLTTAVLALPSPFLLLRVSEQRTAERNGEVHSPFQEFLEGMRYVRGSAVVLALIALGAAGTMFAMPFQSFMPVFARDLQAGPQGLGILQGAVGIGSLAGVVFLSLQKSERPSTAVMVGGSLSYGLAVTLFALSPAFWSSVLIAFTVGVFGTLFLTTNFTMVQLVVPDELRGRVLSIRMVIFGMQPVGQIGGGAAAEFITTKYAVAMGGLICVALMLLVLARAPELRRS